MQPWLVGIIFTIGMMGGTALLVLFVVKSNKR
jgi:hypothetical protein